MANIIISPSRYVQGKEELLRLSKHVEALGKNLFILGSESGLKRVEATIQKSFEGSSCKLHFEAFNRECSKNEIHRLQEKVRTNACDVIVGIGGGKTLDTAKAVAYYEKLPVVIIPTIASTDAPCSALSVLYTDDGVFEEYLFLPQNPNLVLVDTDIVSKAPVRLLVAGMGDALATYFEARACAASNAANCAGGNCTKAVENIVEANTYLSGIGFESAGLAGAHAIHNGLTVLSQCHDRYHGEKVAFGTIAQLVLENAPDEELSEVLGFCVQVGLPITLAELGITEIKPEEIMKVAQSAAAPTDTIHNMPFPVTAQNVYDAILAADAIGRYYHSEE